MTDLRDSIARLSLEQSHKLLNQLAGHSNVSELVRAGVQAALAPPPPAAPPGAVLGKDKSFWSELTTVEQAAAAVLGYSAQVWDAGGDTTATAQPWASLQNEERIAAQRLGYTEPVWEKDRAEMQQASEDAFDQEMMGGLNVNDSPPPAAPPPTAAPTTLAKDKQTWEEFTPAERQAAAALGWDGAMWNEGQVPECCEHHWRVLDAGQKRHAEALGYTQALWDEELEEEEVQTGAGGPPASSLPSPAGIATPPPEGGGDWVTAAGRRARSSLEAAATPANGGRSGRRGSSSSSSPVTPTGDEAAGYLFFCTKPTGAECFKRSLFGAKSVNMGEVSRVGPSTALFLFEFQGRTLYGPFTAASAPAMNIEEDAWAKFKPNFKGPDYKPFPAQVRVAREGPVRKVMPPKSLRLTEGALDAKAVADFRAKLRAGETAPEAEQVRRR